MSDQLFESILSLNSGGANQDDSLIAPPERQSAFEQGDYLYARGLRIGSTASGNLGAGETYKSTLEVSSYWAWNGSAWASTSAPSGTTIVRGQFIDLDEGAIYYAVYNGSGNHAVLKFVKSERKIYEILKWSGLNFSATKYISMTKINNYLILTDKTNPPRCFNVTTIYSYKYTLGSNFSEYHISFAKWPPLAPPVATSFGASGNTQIATGLFQFSYRYVYFGGLRSTWSPPSVFVSLENATTHPDEYIRVVVPGFVYNYETGSYFQHSSVKFYTVVQYIEFGFRQSARDPWKLFKRQVVDTGSNSYADFATVGAQATIAQNDIGQYFDSVPFLSGAVEAVDNRPMFGDNTDDLAISAFSVSNIEIYSVPSTGGTFGWAGTSFAGYTGLGATDQTILTNWRNLMRYTFKEGGIYKLGIVFQHYSGRTGLVQTTDDWTYSIPRLNAPNGFAVSENFHALGFKIPGGVNPPSWAVAYQIVRSNCLNIEFFINGIVNEFILLKADTALITSDQTVTPQAAQDIINQYHNSSVLGDKLNTLLGNPLGDGGSDPYSLSQRLANYYRKSLVVSGGTCSDASQIYIDINNWANASSDKNAKANNLYYNFQKGDRVRFKANPAGAGIATVFDVPIVDYTGKGIIVNIPKADAYNSVDCTSILKRDSNAGYDNSFTIEVYRPKPYNKNTAVEFFEMGEWYPISGGDFEKRDFTWTDETTVAKTTNSQSSLTGFNWYSKWPIINGDVHYVTKRFYFNPGAVNYLTGYTDAIFMQMNQDKDNAGGYWEHNNGRPYVAYNYPPILLDKPTQIRFGNKFLEDSVFVNINRFQDQNQFVYPSEYGRIRRLINTSNAMVESVGNILLVLGEEEAWSIYVNRTTLEDLSGRTQVSIADRVLGSYNTLLGTQGTLNPESAFKFNGRVIWWNAKKACWNRYSRDGITQISDFKLKNWFRDLATLLKDTYATATPPWMCAVYDNYHDEWITRVDHSSLPGTFKGYSSYKCVAFAERNSDKRWKQWWDYAPDMFSQLDNEVYSLIGFKVHIHEAGSDYCSVYGVRYDPQIEFAMTDNSRYPKDPMTISLMATDKWSFDYIRGDWKSNSGTVQESSLPITSLEEREGVYVAAIKRDKNSPNAATPTDGLVNGNQIKTKTLRIFLTLDPSVDYLSLFHWLVVHYRMSPKVPKN